MCVYTAKGTEASDSGGVLRDKSYVLVIKTERKKDTKFNGWHNVFTGRKKI